MNDANALVRASCTPGRESMNESENGGGDGGGGGTSFEWMA